LCIYRTHTHTLNHLQKCASVWVHSCWMASTSARGRGGECG